MKSSLKSLVSATALAAMLLTGIGISIGVETAEAQIPKPRKFSIGVSGGFGADFGSANFLELPTAPIFAPRTGGSNEPAAYAGATNIGTWSAGIVMEYLVTEQLSVGLRGAYSVQNSNLLTRSNYRVGRSDGTFDDGTSEFTLNANIQSVAIEPMVGYNIVEGLNVHLGARVNVTVGSAYTQRETLIAPTDGGFFTTGGRIRNERTGTLPNVSSVTIAPMAGLSYNINLTDRLILTPEAFFAYGIMPLVSDLPQNSVWTASSARAGVSVKYKF
ncbi:MAG: hypothetical protein EAZ92_09570 [Candidatus Kapaibacterium sp.]|nr:MAG: hypothetical protein EAZ92_09570 [Candidatus Kapabacteria bacterium]